MVLMVEKGIMQFTDMQKLITNIWKIMIKITSRILDVNNFYDWAIFQKKLMNNVVFGKLWNTWENIGTLDL